MSSPDANARDFIALGLREGRVEFRFDLGSGTGVIRSDGVVALNEWHHARVKRSRKEGLRRKYAILLAVTNFMLV